MATISMYNGAGANGQRTRQDDHVAYKTEFVIDFAEALAEKGSALAADDIIEAIAVPAGTAVLAAGIEKMTADDSTTLTLHLGITTTVGTATADIDEYVVSFDFQAAAVGAYSPALDAVPGVVVSSGVITLDVELATLTGTLTEGKCRVWAILCPIGASNKNVGIAQVGS